MRTLVLFIFLALSMPAHAQSEGRVRLSVPTLEPANAEHVTELRRRTHRRQAQIQRCAEGHSSERAGRIELSVEVRFGPAGRFIDATIEERNETIHDALATCLLRIFTYALRDVLLPGALRASLPITYVRPTPPRAPSSAELADAAWEEANAAREFGRCYLNAGNRLRAAARMLRGARGRARERALARAEDARAALGLCRLAGTPGSLAGAQVLVQECFGCRSAGEL